MLDADTLLMQRALGLAQRGAGLVSPNPMVGAVLVNDGRVVGEGYHRYDLLKHAESYAIEMAGELARGATLYCNLEPCCHQGRTPPCTDALIEARISRVVIASKDPNPRVNGRGIDQLRDAHIEVEVGVLEEHALRLNESYFKFIISSTPFVHGVIEYPDSSARLAEWRPSNEFLEAVSQYDAVMIGGRPELNGLVLDKAMHRERHRPLVIPASDAEPWILHALRTRFADGISVVPVEAQPSEADVTRKVVRLDEGIAHGVPQSQLGSLLAMLARMNVTSLLTLPGIFDLSDPSNFEELDKVTLAIPGSSSGQGLATHWAFGDVEFDLEDVTVSNADGFSELTGYPSLRGVA